MRPTEVRLSGSRAAASAPPRPGASRAGRPIPPAVVDAAGTVAAGLPLPHALAAEVAAQRDDAALLPHRLAERLVRSPEAAARALESALALRPEEPFATVEDALQATGVRRLRRAFRAAGTHSVLDATPGPAGMSQLAFSARSAQVAAVSAAVCRAAGAAAAAASAWSAGLLHDIGLAVLTADPVDGPGAGEPMRGLQDLPVREHPVLGAWLASRWRLAPDLVRAVRCHEDPRPPQGAVARSVWLATRIVEGRMGLIPGREVAVAGVQFGLPPAVLEQIAIGEEPVPPPDPAEQFTSREAQVLRLLSDGLTPKRIAVDLECSVSTVHNHLHHAYRKLGVSSQAQAVLAAREKGLV